MNRTAARGRLPARFAAGIACVAALAGAALASQDDPRPAMKRDLSGLHAFDLRSGKWIAHHRRLKERLAGSHAWESFEGTQTFWTLMDGASNVDENTFDLPGGAFRGATLRSYDPASGEWSIWWLDGRKPREVDTPVRGRFEHGVGTFYAHDTLRGKPVRVRFVWSRITADGAHWEQAFSGDGGKTWETNWTTEFERAR